MNKRGAYFFVIDAMIASAVVIAGIIFMFTTYNAPPDPDSTIRTLDGYMKFLSTTKMRDYQGSFIDGLVLSGNITNLDNSVEQQLLEFCYMNASQDFLQDFMKNVSKGAVSPDRSLLVSVTDGNGQIVVFNRSFTQPPNSPMMLGSRHIAFKRINETTIYGPVVVEVKIWV